MSEAGEGTPHPKESKAEKSAPERAEAAVDGVDKAARESSDEELVDKEKKNAAVIDVIAKITPEFDGHTDKREAYVSAASTILNDIGEQTGLGEDDARKYGDTLVAAEFNRVQAEKFLNSATKLDPDAKEKVLSRFPTMSDEEREKAEKKDKMSPREAIVKGKIADVMKSKMEKTEEKVQDDLDKGIEEANRAGDPEKAHELMRRRGRVNHLMNRFKEIFTDRETGKQWAEGVGKVLYYLFIIAFLFIIWEMNAMNKLGRSK
jgi:hypothetical protein